MKQILLSRCHYRSEQLKGMFFIDWIEALTKDWLIRQKSNMRHLMFWFNFNRTSMIHFGTAYIAFVRLTLVLILCIALLVQCPKILVNNSIFIKITPLKKQDAHRNSYNIILITFSITEFRHMEFQIRSGPFKQVLPVPLHNHFQYKQYAE